MTNVNMSANEQLRAHMEDFARQRLTELGVPATPLKSVGGWSNAVWLAPEYVVRISSGRFIGSFAHEIASLQLLPATVPHATVCAYGQVGRREWMIQKRVPGQTLYTTWPTLSAEERQAAITQLGAILRALHAICLPEGFVNSWMTAALAPGGQPENAYHPPPTCYAPLIEAALRVPAIDQKLIRATGEFIAARLPAFQGDTPVLVHDDIHFMNIMWADGTITALLDFEGAKPAPADQELDTLLRCVRDLEYYGGSPESQRLTAAMVGEVPHDLQAAYPALFRHPRLQERLAVYEALWQLVQILNFAPADGATAPLARLANLLRQGDRWVAY